MRITETLSSAGLTDQTSLPSSDIVIGVEFVGPGRRDHGTTAGFFTAFAPSACEPRIPKAQADASAISAPDERELTDATTADRHGASP